MTIIIVGAGSIGYYLSRSIITTTNHKIKIIEKDPIKCAIAANKLDIPITNGDGSDITILQKVNAKNADILVVGSYITNNN